MEYKLHDAGAWEKESKTGSGNTGTWIGPLTWGCRGRHDAFHNIGKNADYNEIVNSYPSFASAGSAATFVVVTVAEVLLAVAIIMGIWVRMSALILSLGILLMFAWGGFGAGELEFVWLGVYVFLIISGGGLYAFDTALTPAKPKK
ncbi:MAG: DoxX family protein [Alistipes finegoldii]